ncbi:MAG: DUF4114 domain-containing protein [Chitinivibrionales bacterium]|nr:DUF4114 domain-containing protein [Chitinivibrionales bacterium]
MKLLRVSPLIGLLLAGSLFADIIMTTDPDFTFGDSWDSNPPGNLVELIDHVSDNPITQLYPDVHLDQVDTEIFTGKGAFSIILGEFAGMADETTFGWYEQGSPDGLNQIFDGNDSFLASDEIFFNGAVKDFGFYIDPNGALLYNGTDYTPHYTESALNPGGLDQAAVFKIREIDDTYILGWEDLPVLGRSDADYQDMIVAVKINSVPEPSTISLIGMGLFCLGGFWFSRKKKSNKS